MKRGKPHLVRTGVFLLFLLVTVPAYCQRGSIDINVGETSDKFDTLAPVTGAALDLNGEVTVKKPSVKNGGPSIVAGGEVRVPSDDTYHAKEFAAFGGVAFQVRSNFSIGVNVQVRKIDLPVATLDNQILVRGNLELVEAPIVLKYKFGPDKRAFVHVQGAPEFTPRYRAPASTLISLPHPNFDHGYTLRGSVGYTFGKLYAQGTYETRYFKFIENPGNPSNLYNWKSNMITAGVGVVF
ncbi:MAG: hypothetical protein ABR881_05185 [Candidatus Sulfotelmatobacter sp.]